MIFHDDVVECPIRSVASVGGYVLSNLERNRRGIRSRYSVVGVTMLCCPRAAKRASTGVRIHLLRNFAASWN